MSNLQSRKSLFHNCTWLLLLLRLVCACMCRRRQCGCKCMRVRCCMFGPFSVQLLFMYQIMRCTLSISICRLTNLLHSRVHRFGDAIDFPDYVVCWLFLLLFCMNRIVRCGVWHQSLVFRFHAIPLTHSLTLVLLPLFCLSRDSTRNVI